MPSACPILRATTLVLSLSLCLFLSLSLSDLFFFLFFNSRASPADLPGFLKRSSLSSLHCALPSFPALFPLRFPSPFLSFFRPSRLFLFLSLEFLDLLCQVLHTPLILVFPSPFVPLALRFACRLRSNFDRKKFHPSALEVSLSSPVLTSQLKSFQNADSGLLFFELSEPFGRFARR